MSAKAANTPGKLYGLGVGPGDPELLTLKAARLLHGAPVIAYPAPEEGPSFARAIVASYLSPDKIEIPIRIPMRADRFPPDAIYDRAAATLGTHLAAGRDVAVLCEGDPFFYGSFLYLYARLCDRFAIEIVPAVSSLLAAAAALGAPLAARADCLCIIPATLPAETIKARLASVEAAAIIKLGRHFAKLRDLLRELGLTAQARYVEHATLPTQRILPLDVIDPATVPYFSMILLHRRGQAWREEPAVREPAA